MDIFFEEAGGHEGVYGILAEAGQQAIAVVMLAILDDFSGTGNTDTAISAIIVELAKYCPTLTDELLNDSAIYNLCYDNLNNNESILNDNPKYFKAANAVLAKYV